MPESKQRLLTDPHEPARLSLEAYRRAGGYAALQRAVTSMPPDGVIAEIQTAGLRGRGGAGVQTAEKLRLVARSADDTRYLVCNAYDADERSLIGRTLLARDPHRIIEGIALAAYAVGAHEAYVGLRGAPADAAEAIQAALRDALGAQLLGAHVAGSSFALTISVVGVDLGFMAGEETTLLEIIKGRRAMPQQRPPYPTQYGLYDKPTVVLNVETIANFPAIIAQGGQAFRAQGLPADPGTKLFTVYGPDAAGAGTLIEVPMGTSVADALRQAGIGVSPATARGVVVGGLLGGVLPLSLLDTRLAFDSLEEAGTVMGSSLLEVLPADTCMVRWASARSARLARESCGKCVPCRVGVKRIAGTLEGITSDLGIKDDLSLLDEFVRYVPDGSLCGFGVHAVHPTITAMKYFADDFTAHLDGRCPTGTCQPVRAHRFATKHVLP